MGIGNKRYDHAKRYDLRTKNKERKASNHSQSLKDVKKIHDATQRRKMRKNMQTSLNSNFRRQAANGIFLTNFAFKFHHVRSYFYLKT